VAHLSGQKPPQWLRNWPLEIVCKPVKVIDFPCKKAELVVGLGRFGQVPDY
jgi:hypothetical protein